MADPTCTGGTVACFIVSQAEFLTNIAKSLEPVQRLLTGAAYLIGIAFALKAIYGLKVYGEARTISSSNTSIKEPLVYFFVAAIFIYFPTGLSVVLSTVFGREASILEYGPINGGNQALNTLFGSGSVVGRPLTLIIQVIGLFAFIRGWVLIARSASQGQPPGGTGKGFVHVLGGILAINIVHTLEIINNTLYGTT